MASNDTRNYDFGTLSFTFDGRDLGELKGAIEVEKAEEFIELGGNKYGASLFAQASKGSKMMVLTMTFVENNANTAGENLLWNEFFNQSTDLSPTHVSLTESVGRIDRGLGGALIGTPDFNKEGTGKGVHIYCAAPPIVDSWTYDNEQREVTAKFMCYKDTVDGDTAYGYVGDKPIV